MLDLNPWPENDSVDFSPIIQANTGATIEVILVNDYFSNPRLLQTSL